MREETVGVGMREGTRKKDRRGEGICRTRAISSKGPSTDKMSVTEEKQGDELQEVA